MEVEDDKKNVQELKADILSLEVRRILRKKDYETVEIIFKEAHHELQERWLRGETK